MWLNFMKPTLTTLILLSSVYGALGVPALPAKVSTQANTTHRATQYRSQPSRLHAGPGTSTVAKRPSLTVGGNIRNPARSLAVPDLREERLSPSRRNTSKAIRQIPPPCAVSGQFGGRRNAASGTASYYGEDHRGRLMANGIPFDPDKLTCASWFYPLGTKLQVKGLRSSVVVLVTDRGPNQRLVKQGRIIDLSEAAFRKLAPTSQGLTRVEVAVL